jgi:hypothetical protein
MCMPTKLLIILLGLHTARITGESSAEKSVI